MLVDGGGGAPVREEVSLEEMGGIAPSTTPTKLSDIKLEGDEVPEELRGKSAAELVALARASKAALVTSEAARTVAEARAAAIQPAAPAPAAPVEEVELTREQYEELYQKDPLAAIEYKSAQLERKITKNLASRIGSLAQGTASAQEQTARAKYPDEFALFGDEIKKLIDSGMVNRDSLTTPRAWDDMMSYIRGQPANFDVLVEHRAKKSGDAAAAAARAAESASAGATIRPGTAERTVTAPSKLDSVAQQIAKEFIDMGVFKDEAEYINWSRTQ